MQQIQWNIYYGLTDEQVEESRRKWGSNVVPIAKRGTILDKIKDSVTDPTILVLLGAIGIVCLLAIFGKAHWYEGVGILLAVIIAITVSVLSEYKNEKKFYDLLKKSFKGNAVVRRNGENLEIPADDIVVGDVVLLFPGVVIPADGQLISGKITVSSSALTGESVPEKISVGEKLLRGMVVLDGEGEFLVESVGINTVFARIVNLTDKLEIPGPLKARLVGFAKIISQFAYISAVIIAVVFMFNKYVLHFTAPAEVMTVFKDVITALILAVTIVVVIVPEGLPVMIMVVLARNMQKLMKAGVLVRKLMGIETVGSMDVLICDKTGTLTEGVFSINGIVRIFSNGSIEMSKEIPEDFVHPICMTLECKFDQSGNPVGGTFFDRQIAKYLIEKHGIPSTIYDENVTVRKTFSSETKYGMAITSKGVYIKGAPELLVEKCCFFRDDFGNVRTFSDALKKTFISYLNRWFSAGSRMIAITVGNVPVNKYRDDDIDLDSIPQMTLLGVLLLGDHLRSDSRSAVMSLKDAGVKVILATGDHKGPAVATAKSCGIILPDDNEEDVVVSGEKLKELVKEEEAEAIEKIKVVYRCYPSDKEVLVSTLRRYGHVVGMIGDGINDVGALNIADVGISLGSGTDIAKEASSIILLDNAISAVEKLVLYGRTVFYNIRKFTVFQLSVGCSALLVLFCGHFFGYELPLTVIQLLWMNLIMDTLAAIAFSGEPPSVELYMKRPPLLRSEPIVTGRMWEQIAVVSLLSGSLVISLMVFGGILLSKPYSKVLTILFDTYVLCHIFNMFNCRSFTLNIFERIGDNKALLYIFSIMLLVQFLIVQYGGEVFRCVRLDYWEWILCIFIAAWIIPLDMMRKFLNTVRGGTVL